MPWLYASNVQTQVDCRTVGGGKVKTPSVPVPECDQIGLPRATAKVLAVVTLVITIITAGLKTLVSHATDEQLGPIKI